MRRFELVEGTTSKFWEIEARGTTLHVAWGRIGTKGQSQTKELGSTEAAERELAKLVAKKAKEGYVEVAAKAPEAAGPSADGAERVATALLSVLEARQAATSALDTAAAEKVLAELGKDKAMKALLEPLRKPLENGATADHLLHLALESGAGPLREGAAQIVGGGRWSRAVFTRRGGGPRGKGKDLVTAIFASTDRTRFFTKTYGGRVAIRAFADATVLEELDSKGVDAIGDTSDGGVRVVLKNGDVLEKHPGEAKPKKVEKIDELELSDPGRFEGPWFLTRRSTPREEGAPEITLVVRNFDQGSRHEVPLGPIEFVQRMLVSQKARLAAIHCIRAGTNELALVDLTTLVATWPPLEGRKLAEIRQADDDILALFHDSNAWSRWNLGGRSFEPSRVVHHPDETVFGIAPDGAVLADAVQGTVIRDANDTELCVYGVYNGQQAFGDSTGRWVILSRDQLVAIAPYVAGAPIEAPPRQPKVGGPPMAELLRAIAELHERSFAAGGHDRCELDPLTEVELRSLEEATKVPLPAELRAFLSSPGMLFPYGVGRADLDDDEDDDDHDDADPVLWVVSEGWCTARQVVEQTTQFLLLRDQYDFWPDDPAVVLAHLMSKFLCFRLTDGEIVTVDDHDGEVDVLGLDLNGFLGRYRDQLALRLKG